MIKRKRFRHKGTLKLSKIFQEFKPGERVVLIRELGAKSRGFFPKQFHGKIGTVEGKSGKSYIVKFLNGKTYKRLTLQPVHLKRIIQPNSR